LLLNWFSTATIVDDYGDGGVRGVGVFLAAEDEMDSEIDRESIYTL
jgi:hypothetical protein